VSPLGVEKRPELRNIFGGRHQRPRERCGNKVSLLGRPRLAREKSFPRCGCCTGVLGRYRSMQVMAETIGHLWGPGGREKIFHTAADRTAARSAIAKSNKTELFSYGVFNELAEKKWVNILDLSDIEGRGWCRWVLESYATDGRGGGPRGNAISAELGRENCRKILFRAVLAVLGGR
jgi:hypothetical protein